MPHAGWRVHRWGEPPVWEEFAAPTPGPGEVAVDVEACGVGLTVLNSINGDLSDDDRLLPRVPGHELVGRVTAIGPGVAPGLRGQRVTAYFYLSCGRCPACSAGRQSRCDHLAGWVGVHTDGGYAPVAVLPAYNAVAIGEVDPVAATVAPDAVATPVHVCRDRARVRPGDRVVVIGAGGGVGAHMVQVARLYGGEVAGLEVTDRKLALLEELGAHPVDAGDLGSVDPTSLWSTTGPPDVVIDLVGSVDTLRWSADALGAGGRLVLLTTFRDRELTLDPRDLVFREVTVVGSRYASRAELVTAARLVATGRVRPVIGGEASPRDVLDLHDQLRAGTLLGRGVIVW